MGKITTVYFGLNLSKYDGEKWNAKVAEFKKAVEENGSARASWSCDGRTRHMIQSEILKEALPEYEFEIDYMTYGCLAKKR